MGKYLQGVAVAREAVSSEKRQDSLTQTQVHVLIPLLFLGPEAQHKTPTLGDGLVTSLGLSDSEEFAVFLHLLRHMLFLLQRS